MVSKNIFFSFIKIVKIKCLLTCISLGSIPYARTPSKIEYMDSNMMNLETPFCTHTKEVTRLCVTDY